MKKKTICAGNDILTNGLGLSVFLCAILWAIFIGIFRNTNPMYADLALLVKKLVYTFMALFTAPYLFFYLRNKQYATMDDNGIRFWSIFGKLGFVPWESITKVDLRYLSVYTISNRRFISKTRARFFVISNDEYHVLPDARINPPYGGITRTIPYRTKHFEEYLAYYRPDLVINKYE